MENEIMNYEEVMEPKIETIETEDGNSGLGAIAFMAIGAVGAAAIGAVATFGKKLWNKHKAKKELRQPNEDEIVEVTDEQIEEVAK